MSGRRRAVSVRVRVICVSVCVCVCVCVCVSSDVLIVRGYHQRVNIMLCDIGHKVCGGPVIDRAGRPSRRSLAGAGASLRGDDSSIGGSSSPCQLKIV